MSLLSEDHILEMISRYFPQAHPSLLLGRGDDCAVLRGGPPLCVSSDLFLEDIHFRRSYFTPAEIGHKALAVNVSDIAAMGARPLGFTLCLGLPQDIDAPWLDEFLKSMSALAGQHRMALAGGDLARSPHLHVSITVWGEPSTASAQGKGTFLLRGSAQPGDSLFVVGHPGLARVGLLSLEALGHKARSLWPRACAAHLTPTPQVDAGLILSRAGMRPPSLMDLSDGLARDLPRLLGITGGRSGSSLGAEVVLPAHALHSEVVRYCQENGLNPIEEAWLGGEDYALLGACAPELLPALHAALPALWSIGTVTDSGVIVRNGEVVGVGGFDHFG